MQQGLSFELSLLCIRLKEVYLLKMHMDNKVLVGIASMLLAVSGLYKSRFNRALELLSQEDTLIRLDMEWLHLQKKCLEDSRNRLDTIIRSNLMIQVCYSSIHQDSYCNQLK